VVHEDDGPLGAKGADAGGGAEPPSGSQGRGTREWEGFAGRLRDGDTGPERGKSRIQNKRSTCEARIEIEEKNSRFPAEDRTHSHVAGRGVVEAAGGGVQAPDRFPSGHDLGAPGVRRGRDPDRSHSN